MTRSHHCWFITNIWKSDHHLNMILGTDIEFSLSFLSAKSLCWWKWILSYFKTQKLWSEGNLNTIWWGLSSDMDNAVLSISHTSVILTFQGQLLIVLLLTYFQTVAELFFCSQFMPLKAPSLCPNYHWHECTFANFHWGTEALVSPWQLLNDYMYWHRYMHWTSPIAADWALK